MSMSEQSHGVDRAFERIEETILPSISLMLDTLLDAAELRRAGIGSEAYAGELRTLARELETLTRQVEAFQPSALPQGYAARVA